MLKKIENYIFNLKEKIGEGSFSRVYKGTNIHNQSTVAVKKVRVSDVKSRKARLLECEVNILKEVKHPKETSFNAWIYTSVSIIAISSPSFVKEEISINLLGRQEPHRNILYKRLSYPSFKPSTILPP